MFFPVFRRRLAAGFFETLGKIALGREPALRGDRRHRHIRGDKEFLTGSDPFLVQVTHRGLAIVFCERMGEIVFVQPLSPPDSRL